MNGLKSELKELHLEKEYESKKNLHLKNALRETKEKFENMQKFLFGSIAGGQIKADPNLNYPKF